MGLLALAAVSMTSCAADPALPTKAPLVGGPCAYATQPGRLVVTGVDAGPGQKTMAHFQFLPAGQDHSDGAGLEADFATAAPSQGESFPGRRQMETQGTCTPLAYFATIAGMSVQLTITAWPK
jgi:hypothetical protein